MFPLQLLHYKYCLSIELERGFEKLRAQTGHKDKRHMRLNVLQRCIRGQQSHNHCLKD